MTQIIKKCTYTTIIGLVASLSIGCGSTMNTRGSSAMSSQSDSAECTSFSSGQIQLRGKASTYYHDGKYQADMVRIRITELSPEFDTNPNAYIKMFKWQAFPNGSINLETTALNFRIEQESSAGHGTAVGGYINMISANVIASVRSQTGIGGSSSVDFFNRTILVAAGLDYSWNAVKVVLYNGNNEIGNSDFLIPAFSASPSEYAKTHPGVLNQLHPFWPQRDLVLPIGDWITRAEGLCF